MVKRDYKEFKNEYLTANLGCLHLYTKCTVSIPWLKTVHCIAQTDEDPATRLVAN